jgi:hypothetical protein
MQPNAAPFRDQPHEGEMGLPDFLGQLLDIAARQFRVDARLTGVVELDLDSLEVNHGIALLNRFTFPEPLIKG